MNNINGDNRFLKVLLTTQRAKQIEKGAHPLIQISNTRATRIALDEVERGLIRYEVGSSDSRSGCAAAGESDREATELAALPKH